MKHELAFSLTIVALLGCEPGAAPREASESSLPAVELRFVAHGVSSLGFHSSAGGRLSLLALDEPPIITGELALEHMQLSSDARVLVAAETGSWPFLAHAGERGTIAGVRSAPRMPGEAAQLLRLVLSDLQPATRDGLGQDEVQVGLVDTWQASVAFFGVRAVLCLRRSAGVSPAHSASATVSLHDPHGPWWLASLVTTRVELPEAPLDTANVLFVRREHVAALAPDDPELGAVIEALSAVEPVSLADGLPSRERLDELRREAESWPDLLARVRNDEVDASVVTRIAAHLRDGEAQVDELAVLLDDREVEAGTRGRVLAAIGECGTPRCQAELVARLDGAEHDMLAVLARVDAPTSDTLDAVLALASDGDARTRELAGMLLHRHAQHDVDDALARARSLITPQSSCSADVDAWLGLLGNAGLPGSDAWLLDCLANEQPSHRRVATLAALRRIPGEAVTRVLLEHVRDADEAARDASLRALVRRDTSEAELASLAGLELATWRASSLQLLLDLLDGRAETPELHELVERVAASPDPEVGERARDILDALEGGGHPMRERD